MSSKINNNSDVSHIYYDLSVTNNNTNQPSNLAVVPCTFSQNRENPYLDSPEDYSVTVPYLKLDSNNFPLQVIQPETGLGLGPSFTTFSIFIGVKSGSTIDWTPSQLYWISPDITLPVPNSSIYANYTNEYYYNYSYNYLLNM